MLQKIQKNYLIALQVFLFFIFIYHSNTFGNDGSDLSQKKINSIQTATNFLLFSDGIKYSSKILPQKFIAVTCFTSGSYGPPSSRLEQVIRISDKALFAGLQAVNLVVDWRDIETIEGEIDFKLLENMIYEIKSRGLYCILRVYANAEGNHQAWPDWLNAKLIASDKFFVQPEKLPGNYEILPWVNKYKTSWESFLRKISAIIESSTIQPDAVQITLGGSFGEQVLGKYDSTGWTNRTFTDTLFDAEKWHVSAYMQSLGAICKTHIVMVNSLFSTDAAYEDQVFENAFNSGVSWAQSNAGSCSLKGLFYGPDNAKMLARAYNRGASIFLEDESGYWSCKDVGLSPLLKNRVEYMKELQKNYIFLFSAVSIYESDIDDGEGVKLLKNMLGI